MDLPKHKVALHLATRSPLVKPLALATLYFVLLFSFVRHPSFLTEPFLAYLIKVPGFWFLAFYSTAYAVVTLLQWACSSENVGDEGQNVPVREQREFSQSGALRSYCGRLGVHRDRKKKMSRPKVEREVARIPSAAFPCNVKSVADTETLRNNGTWNCSVGFGNVAP